ncbi:unnamed protein product [Heligmosomoides polygyrus]|uniref:GAF domain-containing protein n=1 Tax=Heligmosomoides polygyrus TaxID=6339 RepID=A0A183FF22_HELPZ|nr:unnamed protein product [Heligmosomoides polygyrus]
MPAWTSFLAATGHLASGRAANWHDANMDEFRRRHLASCQLGRISFPMFGIVPGRNWGLGVCTWLPAESGELFVDDLASCQFGRVACRSFGILPTFILRLPSSPDPPP